MDKYVLQKGDKVKRYLVSIDANRAELWSLDINEAYQFVQGEDDLYDFVFPGYAGSLRADGEEVFLKVNVVTKIEIVNA